MAIFSTFSVVWCLNHHHQHDLLKTVCSFAVHLPFVVLWPEHRSLSRYPQQLKRYAVFSVVYYKISIHIRYSCLPSNEWIPKLSLSTLSPTSAAPCRHYHISCCHFGCLFYCGTALHYKREVDACAAAYHSNNNLISIINVPVERLKTPTTNTWTLKRGTPVLGDCTWAVAWFCTPFSHPFDKKRTLYKSKIILVIINQNPHPKNYVQLKPPKETFTFD